MVGASPDTNRVSLTTPSVGCWVPGSIAKASGALLGPPNIEELPVRGERGGDGSEEHQAQPAGNPNLALKPRVIPLRIVREKQGRHENGSRDETRHHAGRLVFVLTPERVDGDPRDGRGIGGPQVEGIWGDPLKTAGEATRTALNLESSAWREGIPNHRSREGAGGGRHLGAGHESRKTRPEESPMTPAKFRSIRHRHPPHPG